MKMPGCYGATGLFLLLDCLPSGICVGGKMGHRLRFGGAFLAQICLIDLVVLIDHKAHHAAFSPFHRPGH